jgi:hypothetical protein
MHRLRLFCETNFLSVGHDKIKKPIKSNSSLSPMSQVYHWNFWWIQSIRDSCNNHVCIETRCCERMFFGKFKTFYNKIIILIRIYIKRCWQEGGMFSKSFKKLYNKIIIYKKEVGRRGPSSAGFRESSLDNFLPQLSVDPVQRFAR